MSETNDKPISHKIQALVVLVNGNTIVVDGHHHAVVQEIMSPQDNGWPYLHYGDKSIFINPKNVAAVVSYCEATDGPLTALQTIVSGLGDS